MHLQMEHLLVRLSLRALVNLALRALVKLTFPARTMYSQRRTMARGLGLKIADSVDHLDHNPREALHWRTGVVGGSLAPAASIPPPDNNAHGGHVGVFQQVRGASDIASVAGSGVGLCFFIVLAALHLYIFANKDPQVNDYFVQTSNRGRDGQSVALARGAYFNGTKQTKGEFRYNVDVEDEPVVEWLLPDVAISMRSTAKSEAEFLQYVWPDFIWSNDEVDPLSSRNEKIDEPLPVKLGSEDCQLDFYGESVFCVRGSPKRVRGWFGEPEWNYLTIKLWPCGSNYTNSDMELGKDFPVDQGSPPHHPALHAQWKKGGGACKSPGDT